MELRSPFLDIPSEAGRFFLAFAKRMSACEVEESLLVFISSLATRHSPLPFVRSTMPNDSISRRDILRTLAFGAAAGSVLQIIPAEGQGAEDVRSEEHT